MFRIFAFAACLFAVALAPVVAVAGPPTNASALTTKTEGLAQLCTARLHLDNTQAAMLRYYLQDEIHTLQLRVEGGTLPAQALPATGRQRLAEVAAHLMTPEQLVGFNQLLASAEAVPHLRGLALLSN